MELRPYQVEAIAKVNHCLATKPNSHPIVELPTGAGKTVIFCEMIRDWFTDGQNIKVLVVAHRQELVEQAEAKLRAVWPTAPIGVYSAGLNRRDKGMPITIAGIQSIHRIGLKLSPIDAVIIDECHLVPNDEGTMYRNLLADLKAGNPHVKYIGFSATPYRMDGGRLTEGENALFTEIAYTAPVVGMIDAGYLCPLRNKRAVAEVDTSGVHKRGGEFVEGELQEAAMAAGMVDAAAAEIVAAGEGRRSWLIFTCGVDHAWAVHASLKRAGVHAPVITGDTNKFDRKNILSDFDAGIIKCVVNVNCLTTGLDVTRIDLIAVVRPTMSTSLWVQMVGRGFRLCEGKKDCLILDFGGNAFRHGPLDALKIHGVSTDGKTGDAPVKMCPGCRELVHTAVLECPECGHQFPERKTEHDTRPSDAPMLSRDAKPEPVVQPWFEDVESVRVDRHQKDGSKPTLKVTYFGKLASHSEWICLEHDGYAGQKAKQWWFERFGLPVPQTVAEAMQRSLYLPQEIKARTAKVKVKPSGKYTQVCGYIFTEEAQHASKFTG